MLFSTTTHRYSSEEMHSFKNQSGNYILLCGLLAFFASSLNPEVWTSPSAMRLLTHNMLTSHVKGVTNGYPLKLQAENIKVMSVDFNPEFVARMIPKLEWQALVQAAESIGHLGDLPRELVPEYESNEEFLKMAHHVLMEVEVIEGNLECPETGRKFPIKNGIPNMLLNEDEV